MRKEGRGAASGVWARREGRLGVEGGRVNSWFAPRRPAKGRGARGVLVRWWVGEGVGFRVSGSLEGVMVRMGGCDGS